MLKDVSKPGNNVISMVTNPPQTTKPIVDTWHVFDGNWVHVVQTRDKGGRIHYFVDGEEQDQPIPPKRTA